MSVDLLDDDAFSAWAKSVIETSTTTAANDTGAMPHQETADDTTSSVTPDKVKVEKEVTTDQTTATKDETKSQEQVDKPDLEGYVPKEVVKKVRHERREAEKLVKQTQRELDELRQKLAYYEQQGKQAGIEYKPPKTEITPDLMQLVKEGDPDAIGEALEILSRQSKTNTTANQTIAQSPDAPYNNSGHWAENLTDIEVQDVLEEWNELAQSGDKIAQQRWAMAIQASQEVINDAKHSNSSPDEIGKAVIALTRSKIQAAAASKVNQAKTSKPMPDSLSGASASSNSQNLLGLSGVDLIARLDAMR